jgi:Zn-finger nucleic acid-binding protein
MVAEARDSITVDRCERCRGLWFDARELDQWLAAVNPAHASLPEDQIPRRGIGTRQCPRCSESLETAGWPGLVLDRCPGCRGLFVELNELARIESAEMPHEGVTFEARLQGAIVSAGWTLLSAKGIVLLVLRFLR